MAIVFTHACLDDVQAHIRTDVIFPTGSGRQPKRNRTVGQRQTLSQE